MYREPTRQSNDSVRQKHRTCRPAETAEGEGRPQRGLGRMTFYYDGGSRLLGLSSTRIHARTAAAAKLRRATRKRHPHRPRSLSDGFRSRRRDCFTGQHAGVHRRPDLCTHNGYLKRWYSDIGARGSKANCWPRLRLPRISSWIQLVRISNCAGELSEPPKSRRTAGNPS